MNIHLQVNIVLLVPIVQQSFLHQKAFAFPPKGILLVFAELFRQLPCTYTVEYSVVLNLIHPNSLYNASLLDSIVQHLD